MKQVKTILMAMLVVAASHYGCRKEASPCSNPSINPNTDPACMCRALSIADATLEEGNLPESRGEEHIQINSIQSSARLTAGTTLFVPFSFKAEYGLDGIMLSVVGSGHRWKIKLPDHQENGYHTVEVTVPEGIQDGSFDLELVLLDRRGFVSSSQRISIGVRADIDDVCGPSQNYYEEGEAGLTVRKLRLGSLPGKVRIEYETFTVPDRMDVKFNGQWVASTAPSPLTGKDFPPPSECYDGTIGYVSKDDVLEFDYDPAKGNTFEIYMYGCFNGSTKWEFRVYCPN